MSPAQSSRSLSHALRTLLTVGALGTLAACGGPAATNVHTTNAAGAVIAPGAPAPTLTVTPGDGAANVRLDARVAVAVNNGLLDTVDVHTDSGAPITGSFSRNHTSWSSDPGLDPNTHYTVAATAHGDGGRASATAAFATIAADKLTTDVFPGDGATVGVGMPIVLKFSGAVDASHQADLVKHIQVQTSTPIVGAWHWYGNQEVHWRPQEYWPTGTKVQIVADIKGMQVSDRVWALGNWTSAFSVGPKHTSVIDTVSHQMQVFDGDTLVHTYPISAGKPQSPTISGTLFVWYKVQQVKMVSTSIGIPVNAPGGYDETVYWDTAISTDGFYVHAAPWSVYAQGNTNVSHGCVNLSTANATEFFNFSQVGDIVKVTGTSRQADYDDGESDWQIPFDQYANSGGVNQAAPTPSPGGGGGI